MIKIRLAALVASLAVIAGVWIAVPVMAATGVALDHPGWADPELADRGISRLLDTYGGLIVDEVSWWPPGRRYSWIDGSSGEQINIVDPWKTNGGGRWWTFKGVVLTLLVSGAITWRPVVGSPRRRLDGTATD